MPPDISPNVNKSSTLIKQSLDQVYDFAVRAGFEAWARNRSYIDDALVARALLNITKVKTLWRFDRAVSLYSFYFPLKIKFPDDVARDAPQAVEINKGKPSLTEEEERREGTKILSLKDIWDPRKLQPLNRNIIIQGTAGQGKSIFLRFLCGQELIPEVSSGRIPIFIELRRINQDMSLEFLIMQSLKLYGLPAQEELFEVYALSGKFMLLLDAFDEIDPEFIQSTVATLDILSELYCDTLQILVSTRQDAAIQHSSRFIVCRLAGIGKFEHLPFLKCVSEDEEQAHALLHAIRGSPAEIGDLLTTPLMLTLLVILYISQRTVPDTVPKFYDELFEVLFYRHDQSKPGFTRKRYTQLTDTQVKELFAAFCFYARIEKPAGNLSRSDFAECCTRAAKACGLNVDAGKFRTEIVKTVCLMQEEGFETSFIHKSVAQYYAAYFVKQSGDVFARKYYDLMRHRPGQYRHWALELRFLSHIDAYRFATLFQTPMLADYTQKTGVSIHDGPTPQNTDATRRFLSNLGTSMKDRTLKIHSDRYNDFNPIIDKLVRLCFDYQAPSQEVPIAFIARDVGGQRKGTGPTSSRRSVQVKVVDDSRLTTIIFLHLLDVQSIATDAAEEMNKQTTRTELLAELFH